ncbi:hypothetical protein GCM10027432_21460 [Lysobacter fragariae]
MYSRYAERQRWKVEGGFKEVIARVEGRGAYSRLKFESGTHRVQRVGPHPHEAVPRQPWRPSLWR